MSYLNDDVAIAPATVSTDEANAKLANASTKDAGLVKVGAVSIRFKSASAGTKDSGRVRIGGAAIRF